MLLIASLLGGGVLGLMVRIIRMYIYFYRYHQDVYNIDLVLNVVLAIFVGFNFGGLKNENHIFKDI